MIFYCRRYRSIYVEFMRGNTLTLMAENLDIQSEDTDRNNSFYIANYHNSSNTILQEARIQNNLFRGHLKDACQVPNDTKIIFVHQRHQNDRAHRNYNGSDRRIQHDDLTENGPIIFVAVSEIKLHDQHSLAFEFFSIRY